MLHPLFERQASICYRHPVIYLKPDYDQHYSILFSLGNPLTELCTAMLAQMGLTPPPAPT